MARQSMSLVLLAAVSATATVRPENLAPISFLQVAPDLLQLSNGYVFSQFNLTHGSLDVLQGRYIGDGDFSASPNLAGYTSEADFAKGGRRGAFAIVSNGLGYDSSTSSFDRPTPLTFTITSNTTTDAGFCVNSLTDGIGATNHFSATLCFSLASSNPRALSVNMPSLTTSSSFSPSLVSLASYFNPPDTIIWYANRGVRQGYYMSLGYIASPLGNNVSRYYCIGNGSVGAVEITVEAGSATSSSQSYIYAGQGAGQDKSFSFSNSGLGLTIFGAPSPADSWVSNFDGSGTHSIPANTAAPSPLSLLVYPNDYSFPPSNEISAEQFPAKLVVDDVRSILTAVHGSPVSALHSYDYAPEVRAAPCLVYKDGQCYAPLMNFYDPDSGVSNSAMLYSFDPTVLAQVRGQLETNLAHICGPTAPANQCVPGQCIHHFVGNCQNQGPECVCVTMPSGVQDCFVYDAISGAVQTGPNVFTTLASLRYAGTSGDLNWLTKQMPLLRSMMGFLESAFNPVVGLYSVPGSLQIDVFIRNNYTADSNAMIVILSELFAEAEASLGNATGSAFYMTRASVLRASMNKYLFAASGDHYCTQSNDVGNNQVDICSRDFIDYDANAIAVAAGVPTSNTMANKILARMDSGSCTHAGRATYVSEIIYNTSNCVNGNTGDSQTAMGRIAWQDSLARKAVGDAAASSTFANILLGPLQADLLRRTWLPERFTCSGADTHSQYYFEYPAVVALMLYEVKYGISMQMDHILVDPLVDDDFDFAIGSGGLHIGYHATAGIFSAQLPSDLFFAGTRTFVVSGMNEGAWTITPSGGNSFPVTVGSDGVLTFTAAVGGGASVTAQKQ